MEENKTEIIGFTQNVSPLGQGQTKKNFDFQVQTEMLYVLFAFPHQNVKFLMKYL